MTTPENKKISNALDTGDIETAVALALDDVKSHPKNEDARRLLIDLLIIHGDFERSDKQADILANTAGELTLGMTLLRGRLRAAKAREAWFETGAVPAFPSGPTERDKLAMQLALAKREGNEVESNETLISLTSVSETNAMVVNGKPVEGFRDADDRIPHALEVLCSDGSYMWVDFTLIEKVDFTPASAIRDLVWRPAKLVLNDGAETDVVICSTYYDPEATNDEKLARTTGWAEASLGAVTGKGQKAFLAGDDAMFALEISSISSGSK